jgi:glutamine synthetase
MMLNSGLDGIKNDLPVPPAVDKDIFEMNAEQMAAENVTVLPGSLEEALGKFKDNPLSRETLGDHIFAKYIEAKTAEWDSYRCAVTGWELDNYLAIY